MFAIESKFKFVEHIYKNKLEKEIKEIEEKIQIRRKIEEERRERRLQTISSTSELLKQINSLVSQVRVYGDKPTILINDLIAQIAIVYR